MEPKGGKSRPGGRRVSGPRTTGKRLLTHTPCADLNTPELPHVPDTRRDTRTPNVALSPQDQARATAPRFPLRGPGLTLGPRRVSCLIKLGHCAGKSLPDTQGSFSWASGDLGHMAETGVTA